MPGERRDAATLINLVEAIHRIYTPYHMIEDIKAAVAGLVRRDNSAGGVIHMLVGASRAGKSRFLDDFMRGYPKVEKGVTHPNGDFARHVPVALSKVPRGTGKAVAEQIYLDLAGVPASAVLGRRYDKPDVVREIVRVARECRTKLLVLEETHQSFEERSSGVASDVAIILKDLTNEKLFSILAVGTGKLLNLLEVNEEFKARCVEIHSIRPFEHTPADLLDWTDILGNIDDHLAREVFGRLCGLNGADKSSALMIASNGILGHMATLVVKGGTAAVREMAATAGWEKNGVHPPEAGISMRHLEVAFATWAPGIGRVNPFSPEAAAIPTGPASREDGPASGVKGRSKRNSRDTGFRK